MRIEPLVPVLRPPIDGGPDEARVLERLHEAHVIFGKNALDARREPVWKSTSAAGARGRPGSVER